MASSSKLCICAELEEDASQCTGCVLNKYFTSATVDKLGELADNCGGLEIARTELDSLPLKKRSEWIKGVLNWDPNDEVKYVDDEVKDLDDDFKGKKVAADDDPLLVAPEFAVVAADDPLLGAPEFAVAAADDPLLGAPEFAGAIVIASGKTDVERASTSTVKFRISSITIPDLIFEIEENTPVDIMKRKVMSMIKPVISRASCVSINIQGTHVPDNCPTMDEAMYEAGLLSPRTDTINLEPAVAVVNNRRSRIDFSEEEEELLVVAVESFGACDWNNIKDQAFKHRIRTSEDLRMKWKSLLKTASLSKEKRRGNYREELIQRVRVFAVRKKK